MTTCLRSLFRRSLHLLSPVTFALLLLSSTASQAEFTFESSHAEKQYVTALLTAMSAAKVNHPQMATFANQHLHQAAYCLYLTNQDPLATIAKLTRSVMTGSDNVQQLAHFERIKTTFDIEYVRADHPCLQGSYPEDRV
ncbi:MAG: hypothetical protein ACRBBW_06965 [Cellvibrionaceae bacterium]